MSTDPNPYQSPTSSESSSVFPHEKYQSKPASVTVFGILALVFGGISLLGGLANLVTSNMAVKTDAMEQQQAMLDAMGYSRTYMTISNAVGLVFSIGLIAIGIGLLMRKEWGRLAFNGYALLIIVWTTVNFIYVLINLLGSEIAENPVVLGGAIGGLIGSLLGLLYPGLGLYFLNRPVVKQSLH